MKRLLFLLFGLFLLPNVSFADVHLTINVSGFKLGDPPFYKKEVTLPDDFDTYKLDLGEFGASNLSLDIRSIDTISGRIRVVTWNLRKLNELGGKLTAPNFSAHLHKDSPISVSWFGRVVCGINGCIADDRYDASITWIENGQGGPPTR